MPQPTCPQCAIAMERGFTVDRSHHSYAVPGQWVSGEPERSIWFGVRTGGGRKRLTMAVYRCPRCGRLEFFAPES